MTDLTTLNEDRCFDGIVSYREHHSEACDAPMRFGIYAPPAAERGPVPALYFLAGLTSTEENFLVKGGAQRYAAEHGLILVAPDTSPRRLGLPGEGFYDPVTGVISPEAGFYGAGFYGDATAEPCSAHYKMHSYVTRELPAIVEANFPAREGVRGISGHSVGGHGALTIALNNPTSTAASRPSPRSAPPRASPTAGRRSPPTSAPTRRRGENTTPASSSASSPYRTGVPSSWTRVRKTSSSRPRRSALGGAAQPRRLRGGMRGGRSAPTPPLARTVRPRLLLRLQLHGGPHTAPRRGTERLTDWML